MYCTTKIIKNNIRFGDQAEKPESNWKNPVLILYKKQMLFKTICSA